MAWLDERKSGYYLRDRLPDNPSWSKPLGKISHKQAKTELRNYETAKEEDQHQEGDLGRWMADVYQEYLRYLRGENYSQNTIRAVGQDVGPFIKTLGRVKDMTAAAVKKWKEHLQSFEYVEGKRYAVDTVAHRLRQIKAFCSWMVDEGIIKKSPFQVSIPEGREDAGRALQGSEVHALFKHWPAERSSGGRDGKQALSKLFFHIVFYGGTRLTEVLGDEEKEDQFPGAQYENLDRKLWILRLAKTKAGKSREVALPEFVVNMIPKGSGPIFRGQISAWTLRTHLAKAAKEAGIIGRFRIHDGRVTAATEWARKNRDPKSAMDQFGWKTAKMAIHYNKVATEERVAQAQKMTYK